MDLEFGNYRLKRAERLLLGPKGPMELSARSFDILAMLLERPDEVIGKIELFDAVWPGLVVEENTLQVHVSALRKALNPGMILTVHGRGYKYVGPRPVTASSAAAVVNEASPPAKPSIAVLPFANMSGDAAQDIFCEGLALNIVASLGRYHELFVIDRFSTLAYRNRPVTSAEAARELSVRYILEGGVQKAGDRIRVSVQLVDGAENRLLWTETYDRQLTDIFAVQDEITGTIIGTLASSYGGRLGKAWRDRNRTAGPDSFAALDHLQRAYDACRFSKEGESLAREHLARAIECDPGLAKAYSKMALGHIVDAYCGWADDYDVSMELARQWAVKAIACDDGESWSHWAFANYHLYSMNHGVALEAFRKALECNPNDAEVTTDYALCLSYAGRAEEGIEHARKAMRLNPFHYEWYTSQLGQIYFDARQYDKAIATFASLRLLDSAIMRVYQAASFAAAGNLQQSQKSVKRVLELDPGATLEKWTDPKLAPYGDAGFLEHFRDALRKAGLPERAARNDEKPSVAVLPFLNLSGDPGQDIFCDGLALNIVASLGRFHELFVIDRFSTLAYKGRTVIAAQAARELAVRYILEGSVQKTADRIRVSVQLVEGALGRQLWTETYDRQLTDIFTVQDEITGTIIGTLASGYGGRLGKAWRERSKLTGIGSFVAVDYLQKALDAFDFTKEGMVRVRELLTKAIDCDPGLAKAHSKIAWAYLVDVSYGWAEDYDATLEEARQWALKAIAADDGDSWAHWAFAGYHMLTLNHGVALEAFQKALDCNPNDAEVMMDYALYLSYVGRAEEGIGQALNAMRLNPHHHDWYKEQLGQIYFDARQYDKAIATFASLRSLDSAIMRVYQAASFAAAGNMQQAQKSVKRALELDPGATLEKWTDAKLAPYSDAASLEHLRQNLRKAGLPERAAAHDEKPSIAVLPFDNMSGDPEQDYFSDGITEDIIAELGKFKEFLVIARNSSFRFRGKANDVAGVAKKLAVQYVVQGSVRKIGNRVRVTVQLIDASSTAHVWGEHYDRELTDIFAIQDEITQMIAARLARQARTAIASHARARPTGNMSAYDFYLRALQLAANYDTVREAEPFLRQAVKLDPRFAAAHAMLGFVESIKFYWVYYNPDHLHAGLEMARTALQLDPDEAYGHLASGFALLYLRRFRQAEISLDRAVALNPNDPFILSIHAILLNYTNRPEEALREVDEARRRDPFALGWYEDFRGIILTTARRYREATACYAKLETVTSWSLAHLTVCHAELGEIKRAQDTLAKLKANWPGLDIDDIIDDELDFFEDPTICSRYRAILQRIDKEE